MKDVVVCVTGAGSPGFAGIIKSLRAVKERKIKIVGVDMDKNASGFAMVDSYYAIPPARDKNFINTMRKVAAKEKVSVILPLVTSELFKFSEKKNEFKNKNINVSVSDNNKLVVANNKFLLMKNLVNYGIPVPKFKLINSYREFVDAIRDFGYPQNRVCFKPCISNGGRGFRILDATKDKYDSLINDKPDSTIVSLEEIDLVLDKVKKLELLVMEYLPGEEYSVDLLANDGDCLVTVPRRRDKIKLGISFAGTLVNDKEIIGYSKKVTSILRLHGNIGLQFKRDKNGVPKLIESNPRLQGTTVFCTAGGVNFPYLAIKLALGENFDEPKINWGVKMTRYWNEIYYDKKGYPFTF